MPPPHLVLAALTHQFIVVRPREGQVGSKDPKAPIESPAAAEDAVMWIDQRGSEVLPRNECQRLLALNAGGVGRLGLVSAGQLVIVPVNYEMLGSEVLVRVGPGDILDAAKAGAIVAFEIDQITATDAWSVLVQGLATTVPAEVTDELSATRLPVPLVPEPGHAFVQLRTDVLSGRRFAIAPHSAGQPDAADR
jgi:uncharacterized protein